MRRYGTSCDLGLTSHHTVSESESTPRTDLMLRVSGCVLFGWLLTVVVMWHEGDSAVEQITQ